MSREASKKAAKELLALCEKESVKVPTVRGVMRCESWAITWMLNRTYVMCRTRSTQWWKLVRC